MFQELESNSETLSTGDDGDRTKPTDDYEWELIDVNESSKEDDPLLPDNTNQKTIAKA